MRRRRQPVGAYLGQSAQHVGVAGLFTEPTETQSSANHATVQLAGRRTHQVELTHRSDVSEMGRSGAIARIATRGPQDSRPGIPT